MFKKSIMSILLMAGFTLQAQDKPAQEADKFQYEEVIEVQGATKDQLFRTARAWFLKNYSEKATGEKVIYTDDSYLGEMAANPNMFIEIRLMGSKISAGAINYNIVVAAKEGKYKYSISGFYHESNRSTFGSGGPLTKESPECGEEEMSLETWNVIKKQCVENTAKLIEDLKKSMAESGSNSDGDW